jgi:hypothetical protein
MLADRTEHEPSETRRQALRCGRVRARGTPAASLQLGPISPFIFAQASLQSGDAAAGPSGPAALAFDRLVGWPAYPLRVQNDLHCALRIRIVRAMRMTVRHRRIGRER